MKTINTNEVYSYNYMQGNAGRFTTPDLLWSAFPAQSPYNYAFNSPLIFSDPSGLAPEKERDRERLMGIMMDFEVEYNVWNEMYDELGRTGVTHLKNADGSEMEIGDTKGGRTGSVGSVTYSVSNKSDITKNKDGTLTLTWVFDYFGREAMVIDKLNTLRSYHNNFWKTQYRPEYKRWK